MNKLFEMKFGSHLYGTNTPDSDLDLKSIYIPSSKEILLGRAKDTIVTSRQKAVNERNTKDDVDIETFSLKRYFNLLTQGQTVALDMLFAPIEFINFETMESRQLWLEIKRNSARLLHRDIAPFIGYARQQAAKYGVKGSRMEILERTIKVLSELPIHDLLADHKTTIDALVESTKAFISLEKQPLVGIVDLLGADRKTLVPHLVICDRKFPMNAKVKFTLEVLNKIHDGYGSRARKAHLAGGIDWKALSHAVRVNAQGIELLQTGQITFPRPDREKLLKIKTGAMPFDEVSEIITTGLLDLETAQGVSDLPEMPDYEYIDNLICQVYGGVISRSPWGYR